MAVTLPSPERQAELKEAYENVAKDVKAATEGVEGSNPRLVVVSKYQPASNIFALHQDSGVRHFGENYPQELMEKAAELPSEIEWHFIGALQSNKAKLLAGIPNLYAIETLSSVKAADLLQKALANSSDNPSRRLNVFLQINTSGEDAKSGLAPLSSSDSGTDSDLVKLATHVLTKCPNLRLKGLMTIGSYESSTAEGQLNPDFDSLSQNRTFLLEVLEKAAQSDEGVKKGLEDVKAEGGLELSCGMSNDFAQAIKQGSSNVRVGSKIFGARPPKKEKD